MIKKSLLLVLFFLQIILLGCSSAPSYPGSESLHEQFGAVDKDYSIGVDDRVEVNVWKNSDLSITVPVRPDGKISVPLIGEVVAGGRSPMQVAEEIRSRLSAYVKDPQVAVILVELRSHEFLSRIRVTGAVRNPISITYRQGMTVLDVVLEAGGLNEFASANGTKLFRKTSGKVVSKNIRLSDILKDGDMNSNVSLRPGDIVSVPERIF